MADERKKLAMAIWNAKHPDFRSERSSPLHPSVLANGGGQGTILLPLLTLPIDELRVMAAAARGYKNGRRIVAKSNPRGKAKRNPAPSATWSHAPNSIYPFQIAKLTAASAPGFHGQNDHPPMSSFDAEEMMERYFGHDYYKKLRLNPRKGGPGGKAKRNPAALKWTKHYPTRGEKRANYSARGQGGVFVIHPARERGWGVSWQDKTINYTESARIGGYSTLAEAKRAAESTIIGGK